MKKFKRIIGAALAAAMALSLTVTPVFAAGDDAIVPGEGMITWGEKTTSVNPEVNPVEPKAGAVTGSGGDKDNNSATENIEGSTILVVFPDGSTKTATVDAGGNWSVDTTGVRELAKGEEIKVYQTEPGKEISTATVVTVGSGKPGEPEPPIKPVDPTKFLSISFPSKFFWYVYQAKPGVVQSPVHKVINNGITFKTDDGKVAKADPRVEVSLNYFKQSNAGDILLADFERDQLKFKFTGDFGKIGNDLAQDYIPTAAELIGEIKSNITTTGNKDTLTFGFDGTYTAGLPAEKLVPKYDMSLHYEIVGNTDIVVEP